MCSESVSRREASSAPPMTSPMPKIAIGDTTSSRNTTPSTSATTGYQVGDEGGPRRAHTAHQRAHHHHREAGAEHADGEHGDQRWPGECRLGEPVDPVRGDQRQRRPLHSGEHRKGPISLLERGDDIGGEGITNRGQDHQHDSNGGGWRFARRGEGDCQDAGESHEEADDLETARQLPQEHGGDDRGEDRSRPVEHPGHCRVDPLLGDREDDEGDRHPDQPESEDLGALGARDARAGGPWGGRPPPPLQSRPGAR